MSECGEDRDPWSLVGGGAAPPAGLAGAGLPGQMQPLLGEHQGHLVTPHLEGVLGLGGAPLCHVLCEFAIPSLGPGYSS